jgi:hypothetical protein
MVITVSAMGMMQMPFHEVIRVVAVRHGVMAAVGPMLVGRVVAAASMLRSAGSRVGGVHVQAMFLHAACCGMMQMAVVEIVGMPVMLNGFVTAVGAVLMRMFRMLMRHG